MDSIRKIAISKHRQIETEPENQTPSKAVFFRLSLKYRLGILLTATSLISWAVPHYTHASVAPQKTTSSAMIFVIGDNFTYLNKINFELSKLYTQKQMQVEIDRQLLLQKKLKEYLQDKGSPLANHAATLIQLNNWKKIIALSNAESGMCKHYPEKKNNCWGVGGSNLWYMGSDLKEGILSMNHFLNTYPNNSKVKYSQMTFKQMNGLYKQPAAIHWVINNQAIYDDLTAIEKSL